MQNIISFFLFFFVCLLIQAEMWHFSWDSPHKKHIVSSIIIAGHRCGIVTPNHNDFVVERLIPFMGTILHIWLIDARCTKSCGLCHVLLSNTSTHLFLESYTQVTLCIQSLYWFPHPSSLRLQMHWTGVLTFDRRNLTSHKQNICDCQTVQAKNKSYSDATSLEKVNQLSIAAHKPSSGLKKSKLYRYSLFISHI